MSFGSTPSSGRAGSIPVFAGNLHTDFHRAALANRLANCKEGSLTPDKPGSICYCLDGGHSDWGEMGTPMV